MTNKNTLLSQSAYAWLGIWFFNQTFYDDYLDDDIVEIQKLVEKNKSK